MGRDFSNELKEHQDKREENRLANEQAFNEQRANALKGLADRPDLKQHYDAELQAIEAKRADWLNAQNKTADNKHREIVGNMAFSDDRHVATVDLGSDRQAATASNAIHVVDSPPNEQTPKQLTYGQGRLEQSRAAANDNKPKGKSPEPEK